MKKFLHILSFLVVSNIFYAQKQENPVLKELNEIILNTKLYGGFYNGMSREAATNEYETNKYSNTIISHFQVLITNLVYRTIQEAGMVSGKEN